MKQIKPDEFTLLVVEGIWNRHRQVPPGEFAAWFCGGIIASSMAHIPDDYWDKIMELRGPCEVPGCDCHVVKDVMLDALDAQRTDHMQHLVPPIAE